MSWIKNPNPTIKPPFGSYIDWSHPLADGLLYCCLLNEFTGRPSNMVDCSIAAENTMTWSGESLEGADSQYCIIKKNERINSVSEYTIISDGEFYDTTDGTLFCHTASNSIYRPAIGIARLYDNNSISLSCCSDTDSDISIVISSSLSGHYAGRRSAVTIDAYFNGGFVDSIASDGGTLLLDNTCAAFGGIGQNTSISNRFLTGKVKYGILWGRLLTPDEIAWQYEEPYAFIFWPSRKVIFDFGSASTISLLADVQAVSDTSDTLQAISRSLLADIAAVSTSEGIISSVSRSLLVYIASQSNTSGIAAALLRGLLAQIAAETDTSTPSASISMALAAGIPAASRSSDPAAEIARQLVADVQAVSNTSDITAALSGVISLIASISGVSSTADADAAIARTLLANIAVTSDTSDITAALQKIISLIASIGNASNTNDAGVSIARDLFAVINAETVLADAPASVFRSLLADIAVTSDTLDITASLQNIISLAAAITGVSLTSDITADMARSLSALIAPPSDAGDITISVARSLLADISGTSITPDDLILVLSGLGLIIDPEIESLTPMRRLESITKKRKIEST